MPPYITWFDLNKEVLSFPFSCKDVHLSHEHKSISSPREASEALLQHFSESSAFCQLRRTTGLPSSLQVTKRKELKPSSDSQCFPSLCYFSLLHFFPLGRTTLALGSSHRAEHTLHSVLTFNSEQSRPTLLLPTPLCFRISP